MPLLMRDLCENQNVLIKTITLCAFDDKYTVPVLTQTSSNSIAEQMYNKYINNLLLYFFSFWLPSNL